MIYEFLPAPVQTVTLYFSPESTFLRWGLVIAPLKNKTLLQCHIELVVEPKEKKKKQVVVFATIYNTKGFEHHKKKWQQKTVLDQSTLAARNGISISTAAPRSSSMLAWSGVILFDHWRLGLGSGRASHCP